MEVQLQPIIENNKKIMYNIYISKLYKEKNMKKIICILLILSFFLFGLAGCKKDDVDEKPGNSKEDTIYKGNYQIEIEIENYGTIYLDLDGESTPITVDNFIKLVKEGFYDGLTFHRIISGFMIQGGDPSGNGTGGSDEKIKGEFAVNGVENKLSHTRGAISMARSNDYNSASSQFFIVHEDSDFLDGSYAAFGYITDGMDIVDKICDETPVQDGNGTVAQKDQPIIKSIKVIE